MTKDELHVSLSAGKTMDELFHCISGQECLIYKASEFSDGNEIIYIPDVDLNNIPMDRPLKDGVEIEDVLGVCYTGREFVDECGGDTELAQRLFHYCDWQHPSSALPEVDCGEDDY